MWRKWVEVGKNHSSTNLWDCALFQILMKGMEGGTKIMNIFTYKIVQKFITLPLNSFRHRVVLMMLFLIWTGQRHYWSRFTEGRSKAICSRFITDYVAPLSRFSGTVFFNSLDLVPRGRPCYPVRWNSLSLTYSSMPGPPKFILIYHV